VPFLGQAGSVQLDPGILCHLYATPKMCHLPTWGPTSMLPVFYGHPERAD
jgi:hypothetical protein